jgi:hypothetical protein
MRTGSSPRIVRRRGTIATTIAGVLLAGLFVLAAPSMAANPYKAYGSCATKAPFAPATHCAFDRPEHAQGTIVFRSHVGKRKLRVCQKITGLSLEGRQCLTAAKPTAYEAIPFHLDGASAAFKLAVTIYTKKPNSSGPYKQVARVPLRFGP